jgi:two-component system chemotaxis response regulator CheB
LIELKKIRVLVVDDSALVRSLLSAIVNAQPDMEVVGTAHDPYIAREKIRQLNPDVITLDIEMPRMDGLDFLERLMRLRPTPVLMVSTLTERGAATTLRALELGAVDFVSKPKIGISEGLMEAGAELVQKIRITAQARVHRRFTSPPSPNTPALQAHRGETIQGAMPASSSSSAASSRPSGTEGIVAVGASTGGTEAIREVLSRMPADAPAIVITQHMPPGFTRSFAARLDTLCRIRVSEAVHGERILPGHAYIAPGDRHLRIGRSGANYIAMLDDGAPVNRHRPSVDVLFDSVAACAGAHAIGLIMTGMGRDGADGLLKMRQAGAWTIAQNEASCVVYGMPKEAVLNGAAVEILALDSIAPRIVERLRSDPGFGTRV